MKIYYIMLTLLIISKIYGSEQEQAIFSFKNKSSQNITVHIVSSKINHTKRIPSDKLPGVKSTSQASIFSLSPQDQVLLLITAQSRNEWYTPHDTITRNILEKSLDEGAQTPTLSMFPNALFLGCFQPGKTIHIKWNGTTLHPQKGAKGKTTTKLPLINNVTDEDIKKAALST